MKTYKIGIFLLLMGLLQSIHAGRDPVSWTASPAGGFSSVPIGGQSIVVYEFTNQLPFAVTLTTEYQHKGASFHHYDGCRNQSLAPKARCNVVVSYQPLDDRPASFRLIYGYHNNRIPLPELSSKAIVSSGSIQGLVGGLPSAFRFNPAHQADFRIVYTNQSQSSITGYAASGDVTVVGGATVTITSNECGSAGMPVTLGYKASCEMKGFLKATSTGHVSLQGIFNYNESGAKQAFATAQTFVLPDSPTDCVVHGHTILPLAKNTYQFSDNLVKYEFNNTCTAQSVSLGQVSVSAVFTPAVVNGAVVTVNAAYDTCSGQTLPASGKCHVLASVAPTAASGNLTLSASVPVGSSTVTAATSSSMQANNSAQHVVHFINQCPFNVWYGIANGKGGIFSPDPTPGSQSASGASSNAYLLSKQIDNSQPSIIDLAVSAYTNGAIWPRTGCASGASYFECETGMCNTLSSTSGTCVVQGNSRDQPVPPLTKFEFTIAETAGQDGVYDVSVINGFNVPVEIKGLGPVSSNNPFGCTAAGAVIQPVGSSLGSCPWSFDPSFSGLSPQDVLWVEPGADDACTSDSDCALGEVCGMAFDSAPSNAPVNRRCGKFIGYSTIANYVGYSSAGQWGSVNLYNQFDIDTAMTTINPAKDYGSVGGTAATFRALLACTPTSNNSANTCYNSNSFLPNCCGCVNWPSSEVPTAVSAQCLNINPDWTSTAGTSVTAKNAILWLKKSCPTAYSFQFDDPSSSFTCLKDGRGQNMKTSYQITFCPGGQTGLPAGKTDGR